MGPGEPARPAPGRGWPTVMGATAVTWRSGTPVASSPAVCASGWRGGRHPSGSALGPFLEVLPGGAKPSEGSRGKVTAGPVRGREGTLGGGVSVPLIPFLNAEASALVLELATQGRPWPRG